ncbi:MAG TPA: isocitrate lyase/phosphoenolpyruvate mutase family protein, partial [Polyangia bacterium]
VGDAEPARTAIDRLVAFAAAGADCLYAPGVRDAETIAAIVAAVAPKPVNLLVSAPIPGLPLARIAELGVRRVSVGGALSRVAWGAFMRAARGLAAGSFDGLADAATHRELDALFRR